MFVFLSCFIWFLCYLQFYTMIYDVLAETEDPISRKFLIF